MLKRFYDIVISFAGLVFTLPLFLLITIFIKLEDTGPVFFRGLRAGWRGKPFYILKFRSMVINADKLGGFSVKADDKRITKIGRLLRRYKLDELPQLFNVLKGEMSLVGPRPEVPMYIDTLKPEEKMLIFSVRPGITDLASLWDFNEGEALRGKADPERAYAEEIMSKKINLQLQYIKGRSLMLDAKIILNTVKLCLLNILNYDT